MSGLNGVTALGQLCFESSKVLQVYAKFGHASSHDFKYMTYCQYIETLEDFGGMGKTVQEDIHL